MMLIKHLSINNQLFHKGNMDSLADKPTTTDDIGLMEYLAQAIKMKETRNQNLLGLNHQA